MTDNPAIREDLPRKQPKSYRNLSLAIVKGPTDVEPLNFESSWANFCQAFQHGQPDLRDEKRGPGYIPARFGDRRSPKGALRHADNVLDMQALVLDLDGQTGVHSLAELQTALQGWAALIHSTYSHTKINPRYRVILPLARPLEPGQLKAAYAALAQHTGLETDPACRNPDRLYYLPACPASREADYEMVIMEGDWLDAEKLIAWTSDAADSTAHSHARDDSPTPPATPSATPATALSQGSTIQTSSCSPVSKRKVAASIETGGVASQASPTTTAASIEQTSPSLILAAGNPILAASKPLAPIKGKNLEVYFKDMGNLLPVLDHLGITANDVDEHFLCVIPGHEERTPSAILRRDGQGRIVYHCFHHDAGWYTLGEVYAAQFYRALKKFRGENPSPELAVWTLRLLVDAGVLPPYPVSLPVLSDPHPLLVQLSDAQRQRLDQMHQAVEHLFRVKWLHGPEEPTALTWRFAGTWSGLSERAAQESIRLLRETGIIRSAGHHSSSHGKLMTLFLPGNGFGGLSRRGSPPNAPGRCPSDPQQAPISR